MCVCVCSDPVQASTLICILPVNKLLSLCSVLSLSSHFLLSFPSFGCPLDISAESWKQTECSHHEDRITSLLFKLKYSAPACANRFIPVQTAVRLSHFYHNLWTSASEHCGTVVASVIWLDWGTSALQNNIIVFTSEYNNFILSHFQASKSPSQGIKFQSCLSVPSEYLRNILEEKTFKFHKNLHLVWKMTWLERVLTMIIVQCQNSGTEGGVLTIFYIWSNTEFLTIILIFDLPTMLII